MSAPVTFTYVGKEKPPSAKSAAHEAQWAPLVAEVKAYCASDEEWHKWNFSEETFEDDKVGATAKRALTALRRYLPKGGYRFRLDGTHVWARRGGGEGA